MQTAAFICNMWGGLIIQCMYILQGVWSLVVTLVSTLSRAFGSCKLTCSSDEFTGTCNYINGHAKIANITWFEVHAHLEGTMSLHKLRNC